eukprot:4318265-Amphidinium_carterae.1
MMLYALVRWKRPPLETPGSHYIIVWHGPLEIRAEGQYGMRDQRKNMVCRILAWIALPEASSRLNTFSNGDLLRRYRWSCLVRATRASA